MHHPQQRRYESAPASPAETPPATAGYSVGRRRPRRRDVVAVRDQRSARPFAPAATPPQSPPPQPTAPPVRGSRKSPPQRSASYTERLPATPASHPASPASAHQRAA